MKLERLLPLACVAALGCASEIQRFPLRDPIRKDPDLREVNVPCRPDKDKPDKIVCMPREYVSAFAWDTANQTVFRPFARLWAVDPGGEAVNVNAFDEVPDSSWFTNRIGAHPMTPEELVKGPCGDKVLDPNGPDGSWTIDMGKPNGANPGFRVNIKGVGKFMLKPDEEGQPEKPTAATAIGARLYHAFGHFAPCDSVVYFRRSLLKLKPGLTVTDNSGVPKPFDQKRLDQMLDRAQQRDGLVRVVASRWLPGRTIGPHTYQGTRDDDPNDVIPHEDRRDVRAGRLLAAWTNHFDSREQNSMDTWMAVDKDKPESSPGHIQHWILDLGDLFGSYWDWDEISRRIGHSYYFDPAHIGQDFVTFGVIERPWDRAEVDPEAKLFAYFSSKDFDPDAWHGGYPNPAFGRQTELDAAWGARIIARMTPAHVEAVVRAGDFTNPRHTQLLIHHLLVRQKAILKRYLTRLSPVTDLEVKNDELCAVDLARKAQISPASAYRYTAAVRHGPGYAVRSRPAVRPEGDGRVCLALPHVAADGGAPPDADSRYVVVEIWNGEAKGALRAHFYDLGPKSGFKLAGIERPSA